MGRYLLASCQPPIRGLAKQSFDLFPSYICLEQFQLYLNWILVGPAQVLASLNEYIVEHIVEHNIRMLNRGQINIRMLNRGLMKSF